MACQARYINTGTSCERLKNTQVNLNKGRECENRKTREKIQGRHGSYSTSLSKMPRKLHRMEVTNHSNEQIKGVWGVGLSRRYHATKVYACSEGTVKFGSAQAELTAKRRLRLCLNFAAFESFIKDINVKTYNMSSALELHPLLNTAAQNGRNAVNC